ncbi:MAG: hypothetical protein WBG58_13745 [Ignavibacteriaceae bacterium]
MSIKSNILIIIIILSSAIYSLAQDKRLTKGAENGYAWNSMGNPYILNDDSKDIYLSGILERLRLLKLKKPLIDSLSCREEYYSLLKEDKPGDITMADMITSIDRFYGDNKNLVIPIVFAYCYNIKKFAGVSEEELISYREKLLAFSNE